MLHTSFYQTRHVSVFQFRTESLEDSRSSVTGRELQTMTISSSATASASSSSISSSTLPSPTLLVGNAWDVIVWNTSMKWILRDAISETQYMSRNFRSATLSDILCICLIIASPWTGRVTLSLSINMYVYRRFLRNHFRWNAWLSKSLDVRVSVFISWQWHRAALLYMTSELEILASEIYRGWGLHRVALYGMTLELQKLLSEVWKSWGTILQFEENF